jgi:hypothetical protein
MAKQIGKQLHEYDTSTTIRNFIRIAWDITALAPTEVQMSVPPP